LGRLIGITLDRTAQHHVGTAEELAGGIRNAYTEWIEALAARGPVVLAIEDVHWADAPARELAEQLLGLLDRQPILIVATLRLDSSSEGARFRLRALGEYPHRVAELPLAPLSPEDAGKLADALAEGQLDPAARALVVE